MRFYVPGHGTCNHVTLNGSLVKWNFPDTYLYKKIMFDTRTRFAAPRALRSLLILFYSVREIAFYGLVKQYYELFDLIIK